MDFISTCAAGLEELVGGEIGPWGALQVDIRKGAVGWSGTLEAGYRACLWSRFSSRIILVLRQFDISGSDDLYEAAHAFNWEEHLGLKSSFAIDCSIGGESPVNNSMFAALRVKDGIVDRFRERTGQRPSIRLERPDVRLNLHIFGRRAVLGLDLSGESLHRRGYRVEAGPAPLKESLAAAIIALSGWNGESMLLDPLCGSGTLLIEAALMHGDSAPGLGRSYFGLLGWAGHQQPLWNSLVEEAVEREEKAQSRVWPELVGYDGDQAAVRSARLNIARAGLEERITVSRRELHRLEKSDEPGCLVCNPPYGERLSEKQSVRYLYQFLGNRLQQSCAGWQVAVFTAAPDFADLLKIDVRTSFKLFNGPLSCRLLCGLPAPVSEPDNRLLGPTPDQALKGAPTDDFSNRLKKNLKQLAPWAAKHRIACFRIYDRDLPEYNVIVDLLDSQLFIREFAPPADKDPGVVAERFQTVVRAVRALFGVGRGQVSISRYRKKDKAQPEKARKSKLSEVVEGQGVFLADLGGAADPGFFLDQRFIRAQIAALIGEAVDQASLLSIFDVGGAASVQAALSGAYRTTTAGLSPAQLERVRMNFARNGMAIEHHRLIEESPLAWLKNSKDNYDVIYINPHRDRYFFPRCPPFSVAAEHPMLIDYAMRRLRPHGRLFFSTMLPSFHLDPALEKRFACSEISAAMLPADFKRQRARFRCWQIVHDAPAI